MNGFVELPNDHVQIGSKIFHIGRHDFRDGVTYTLEVGGGSKSGYANEDVLPIEELKNVRIMDLPKGFGLHIYMPSLPETPEIQGINLKHVFGRGKANFNIGFIYGTWKAEHNLLLYARKVAARLLLELPDCRSASFYDEEVGVGLACDLDIPIEADLYQYIHELDKRVKAIIHTPLHTSDITTKPVAGLKPDEHGAKWWIRYVLIPLAGSATIIALLKIFI
ncbi:MAG: hypothetical protein ACO1PN_06940 [Betaproteobacteria bacterium]